MQRAVPQPHTPSVPSPPPQPDSAVVDQPAALVVTVHVAGRELPPEDVTVTRRLWLSIPVRLALFVAGLGLFTAALSLMRTGAAELVPALTNSAFTDHVGSAFGLGWLGATLLLSGSPVAASALAVLDGGAISRPEAFAMVAGSRFGAAFVVLVVGVIYALRRAPSGQRRAPISIGILSLLLTWLVYVPAGLTAYFLLGEGALDGFGLGAAPGLTSATSLLFGWSVDLVSGILPAWSILPAGVLALLGGFQLFDRVLPTIGSHHLEERPDAWYDRKWPMFALGLVATLATLSVAVSLTLLVPLVASGRVRRANTLPYIAGANITTLADTLVAAILLGNQDAVRIVAALGLSVTLWTLLLLVVVYRPARRLLLGIAGHALVSSPRLAAFTGLLFVLPIALILV